MVIDLFVRAHHHRLRPSPNLPWPSSISAPMIARSPGPDELLRCSLSTPSVPMDASTPPPLSRPSSATSDSLDLLRPPDEPPSASQATSPASRRTPSVSRANSLGSRRPPEQVPSVPIGFQANSLGLCWPPEQPPSASVSFRASLPRSLLGLLRRLHGRPSKPPSASTVARVSLLGPPDDHSASLGLPTKSPKHSAPTVTSDLSRFPSKALLASLDLPVDLPPPPSAS